MNHYSLRHDGPGAHNIWANPQREGNLPGQPDHLRQNISHIMLTHMRTSVDVPDALLEKARRVMQRKGVTLRELVISGLRHAIAESRTSVEFKLEDRSFAGKLGFAPGASEESISDFVREMNDEWRTK